MIAVIVIVLLLLLLIIRNLHKPGSFVCTYMKDLNTINKVKMQNSPLY